MSAQPLPRDATRLRVLLPSRAGTERAIERAVRDSVGDPNAEVRWYQADVEGDLVIVVKQAHGTWWAPMPDSLAEKLGDFWGTFTLRWSDSEPPAEVEE